MKINRKILDLLAENHIVNSNNYNIYKFGLETLFLKIIHIIIMLTASILLNISFEVMAFLCSYMFLRKYCGGYHASSKLKCYLISILIVGTNFVFLSLIKNYHLTVLTIITAGISIYIIIMLSPQDNEQRTLSFEEVKYYKKKAGIVTLSLFSISILISSRIPDISIAIFISFYMQMAAVVISFFQIKIRKHR